jgi:hypothetical protein
LKKSVFKLRKIQEKKIEVFQIRLHKKATSTVYIEIQKGAIFNTGYFMSDNEPGGIENATHNTFPKLT